MVNRKSSIVNSVLAALILTGCGASQPEHPEQPLTTRPAPATDFKSLSKEEKIKYIQNSPAPEEEKKRAIGEVNAGRL